MEDIAAELLIDDPTSPSSGAQVHSNNDRRVSYGAFCYTRASELSCSGSGVRCSVRSGCSGAEAAMAAAEDEADHDQARSGGGAVPLPRGQLAGVLCLRCEILWRFACG